LWERFSRHTKIAHIPAYLSCMRFYPEQKTRAMRTKSLAEYDEIRRRANVSAPVLWPVMRLLARAERVACKFFMGGYRAQAPDTLINALERYRISGKTV
jgi:hypothetical protein